MKKKAKSYPAGRVSAARQADNKRKCRVCGCTDERACPGGCYWVTPSMCSACSRREVVFIIDCKIFGHGKIAADVFVSALEKCGWKNVSFRFTEEAGFRIDMPSAGIPMEIISKPAADRFIKHLKDYCYKRLERELLKKYGVEELSLQVNKPAGKIMTEEGIDPYEIVGIRLGRKL